MARSPLIDVAWGYMRAQILRAAIELDVGEALGAGSRSAADVAASAGTDPTSMLRLLRALTALGVTDHDGSDRFVLTELGHELNRDVPGSVRDIVLFLTAGYVWDAWGDASWSFRTGAPSFDRRHGMGAFDYLSDHPDEAAIFHGAMSQHTREAADAIISSYDFSPFSRVVDLGGGDGTLLARLLRQHPAIYGVLFDLPHGAGAAHEAFRAAGLGDRCEVVGGSFFDGVPAGGDAYILKMVLHDWDDGQATAILDRCRDVVKPDGKVLVVERLLPDRMSDAVLPALLADLLMLVLTGGRERTEAEFGDLLGRSGFALTALTDPLPPLGLRVLEGSPLP